MPSQYSNLDFRQKQSLRRCTDCRLCKLPFRSEVVSGRWGSFTEINIKLIWKTNYPKRGQCPVFIPYTIDHNCSDPFALHIFFLCWFVLDLLKFYWIRWDVSLPALVRLCLTLLTKPARKFVSAYKNPGCGARKYIIKSERSYVEQYSTKILMHANAIIPLNHKVKVFEELFLYQNTDFWFFFFSKSLRKGIFLSATS